MLQKVRQEQIDPLNVPFDFHLCFPQCVHRCFPGICSTEWHFFKVSNYTIVNTRLVDRSRRRRLLALWL